MADKVLLSIITPCRNGADYIERCVHSALGNGHDGVEQIIIDGMSDDETPEILARLQEQYGKRLRVQREPDSSMTEAMVKGFRIARGEWLAPLNCDDFYFPSAYIDLLQLLPDEKADFLIANTITFHENGSQYKYRLRPWAAKHAWAWHLCGCMAGECAVFFRRESYDIAGGYDLSFRFCQDYDLYLRLLKCAEVRHVDIDIGGFLLHESQLMALHGNTMMNESSRVNAFGIFYKVIQSFRMEKILQVILGIADHRKRSIYIPNFSTVIDNKSHVDG